MSVIMTKAKADALASAHRDRHLLTDRAAAERSASQDPGIKFTKAEQREWSELRNKVGK